MDMQADHLQGLRKLYLLLQDETEIHLDEKARFILKNLLDGATEKALENNSKIIAHAKAEEFRDCSKCSVLRYNNTDSFSREVAKSIRRIDSGILDLQWFRFSVKPRHKQNVTASIRKRPSPTLSKSTCSAHGSKAKPFISPTLLDQDLRSPETASLSTSTTHHTTSITDSDSDNSSFPTRTRESTSTSTRTGTDSNITTRGPLRRFRNKLRLILHHHHHHHHHHHRHYSDDADDGSHWKVRQTKSTWEQLHKIFHHKSKKMDKCWRKSPKRQANYHDFNTKSPKRQADYPHFHTKTPKRQANYPDSHTPLVKGLRRPKPLKGGVNKLVWLQTFRRHGGLKLEKRPRLRLGHIYKK